MDNRSNLVLAAVVGVGAGLGAAPACSGPPPFPEPIAPFVDGSRLKAIHYPVEGAPPSFVSWFDTQLGLECSFANGYLLDRPVCFPTFSQRPLAHDAFRFADSACTQPIVGSYYPGESRYLIRGGESDPRCDLRGRLFEVGSPVPSDAVLYVIDGSTGTCRPATDSSGYSELRLLGPEIPLDSLVTGTRRPGGGGGRIEPLTIAGSDGSIQGALVTGPVVLAWDTQREEAVTVVAPLDSASRWYPAAGYSAEAFSDAGCTTRVAINLLCPIPATVALLSGRDVCGRSETTGVFDLGPQLPDSTRLYSVEGADSICVPAEEWPGDPPFPRFSVGDAIPLAAFAEAVEVHTGTAQLETIQAGTADGRGGGAIGWFDRLHGAACTPRPAADDRVRCLPEAVDLGTAGYFADDACTAPLAYVQLPETECVPRPKFGSRDVPVTPTGGAVRHVYPVRDAYQGTIYFQSLGDTECFPLGAAAEVASGQLQFLATGPEIPAADFAPMDLVHPN